MRTLRDAALSMRWHLVDVLAPRPPLVEISFGGTSWTPEYAAIQGAYAVTAKQWAFLMAQFSSTEVLRTAFGRTWTHRTLLADPRAAAIVWLMPLPDALTGASLTTGATFADDPEWEIRDSADRGMVELPFAIVLRVGELSSSGNALYADFSQPMSVQCYPVPQATVDESRAVADAVEEKLQHGFRLQGAGLGRALRVPLWDFDGVKADEAPSYYRNPSDYLRVAGFSTSQLPEEDRRQIRVVATFSVGWRRTAAVVSSTQIVREVRQNAKV